jgi:NADPH:quinone reductase-like Zn-dependent oxidoreductase
VSVTASSVNNTDIWTREGAYGAASDPSATAGWRGVPIDVPRVQGADAVGHVDDVGPDVSRDLVGRRVLVDPAVYDGSGPSASVDALIGSELDGAFAEYLVVDAARVHDVGASPLTDAQLAALPIAYGTAAGMLARARAAAGERLLATGASGGVGIAVVQLAAAMGLEVIASTTADKAEQLVAAGADAVVDRRSDDLAAEVRAVAGGPIDVIADVVGGDAFARWPGLLATEGRIVVAGAIAGPIVEIDLRQVYLRQRQIIGSTMHTPEHFADLVGLANEGRVVPLVAAELPLEEIHAAQRLMRAPETVGKIVIRVAPSPTDDRPADR